MNDTLPVRAHRQLDGVVYVRSKDYHEDIATLESRLALAEKVVEGVEQIEVRTQPGGDMADAAVNAFVRGMLLGYYDKAKGKKT